MRKLCAFIFLFVTLQYCISCQKQLTGDITTGTTGVTPDDSVVLVKTIKSINYDSLDVFYWQTQESYSYDKILNQTVVTHIDSSAHVPGEVENYTEVFQYDSQNRLAQFTSTNKYEPATKIDFSYSSSGDISKAMIVDRWIGKTVECDFKVINQNGQKIITEYDTSAIFNASADTRPEITINVFDTKNRLISNTFYYTIFKQAGGYYKDTTLTQLYYDDNSYLHKISSYDDYFSTPPDFLTGSPSYDSILYNRQGHNLVLYNSFINLFRNLYWFNISEGTYANSMVINGDIATYLGPPVNTEEIWSYDPLDATNNDHQLGTHENTYDANGLPVKMVFPKNFANKYGGKAEFWYTYTKIKK